MNFVDSLKRWFYTNNSSAAGSAARIPLLDANGVAVGSDTYNAISEIVRQELGKILNGGTAQTTGITKVPSLVGNDLGATTVANLASVLGGLYYYGVTDTDMDNITKQGIYYVSGSEHLPSDFGNGMLVVLKAMESRILQIITRTADSQMYWRMTWEDYSQQGFPRRWFEWNRFTTDIPDFYKDYQSLASLASALGAIRYIGGITSSNIDSTTEPGVYSHGDSVSGDGGYGLVLVLGQPNDYLAQIDFLFYSGRVKWRNRASSSSAWGIWKELKLIE